MEVLYHIAGKNTRGVDKYTGRGRWTAGVFAEKKNGMKHEIILENYCIYTVCVI